VDDILRDAASKLNKFKEMAQKQRDGGGASDALVKALTDRHDRDKQVAAAELDAIRKQYAAREKDLESEYAEKLSSVKVKPGRTVLTLTTWRGAFTRLRVPLPR
jgi:hypothetical protein